jgi:hypothetical protein
MTTQAATAPRTPIRSRRRGLLTAPAAAGIGFVVAWVTGLAVWPSNLDVDASGAKVVSTYAGHQGVAVTQYLLVEGLAGIALAVVVIELGRAARRRGAGRLGRVVMLTGIGAVTLSLAECVLGLVLAGAAVPDGETRRAGTLFDLINRVDGAKMLALAALALAGVALARGGGPLPRWLSYVAAPLAAAMIASGVGYLLLSNTLSQAAAVSLPLLLIWVVATGVALGRRSEYQPARRARAR